jgi:hypothetical protein
MADPIADAKLLPAELDRLLVRDVLGFYTQFEITEIFAFPEGTKQAVNVFSLCVAEDRPDEHASKPAYLNPERIRLKGLKGWAFGIARYSMPLVTVVEALKNVSQKEEWCLSGETLRFGSLIPSISQFVPPDSATEVPLNKVLKNNFWAGSYVTEWHDAKKVIFQPFFDDSRLLVELSEAIQKYIPIRLASLSDRLGGIVVQLPVTVITAKFKNLPDLAGYDVELAWHSKATHRPLRVTCETGFDGLISGYASSIIEAPGTILRTQRGAGFHDAVIWDDQNNVVLAATGPMSPVNSIALNMQIQSSEPRIFRTGAPGSEKEHRVMLATTESVNVGESKIKRDGGWTAKRMYKSEAARLAAQRRFVQYRPQPGQQDAEHERALEDLRFLINLHGADAAWLWDPYLDADDVLETLFFCRHANADLRALTSFGETPEARVENSKEIASRSLPKEWPCKTLFWRLFRGFFKQAPSLTRADKSLRRAKMILQTRGGNLEGLRLEFRVKAGSAGWGFHDRFLIFPTTSQGALAWSLGTSVNNLGEQHHILQKVDDGQLIMDAFTDLWEQLDQPEHLVWKAP